MALGTVRTAKGKRMDFAELARRSRKPVQTNADMKDKVVRQVPPARQLNVRGHIPSHVGVKRATVVTTAPATVLKPMKPMIEAKSTVDFTGITIDEPKHFKLRSDGTGSILPANEALKEIMKVPSRPSSKAMQK